MKRLGLLAGVTVLAVAVLGWAFMQRDYDAHAQGTKAPILVLEVRSWSTTDSGEPDPSSWQWQALDDGSLHIAFYPDACQTIALPAGITATYTNPDEPNATTAGPADAIEMCEAVFSRANG
jgi:hypothetical protein